MGMPLSVAMSLVGTDFNAPRYGFGQGHTSCEEEIVSREIVVRTQEPRQACQKHERVSSRENTIFIPVFHV